MIASIAFIVAWIFLLVALVYMGWEESNRRYNTRKAAQKSQADMDWEEEVTQ